MTDSVRYSRRIETAIVTTPAKAQETVDAVATQLGYRYIIVVPDLRELPTLGVQTRDLNGLIGLQMRRNLLLRRNRLLKQTMDWLLALPLCIVSAPIIAAMALWIMAVSDGQAGTPTMLLIAAIRLIPRTASSLAKPAAQP